MKEQHATLPQELQARIITHLADSGRHLGKCALVSKKWLQEARRAFFLSRTVRLDEAAPSDGPEKILWDLLHQAEPLCTFWPYLRNIHICGDYLYDDTAIASEDFIRLFSMCLSRASNLQTLWVDGMPYPDSFKDAFSNPTVTKTITSIRIRHSRFPSPKQLHFFLGLFPQLVKCQLLFVAFDRMECNHSQTHACSLPPSLQFSMQIPIWENSALGLILHHQWSITNLRLDLYYAHTMDFRLITNVLKHIGTPLKSLTLDLFKCPFQGPLPLSLSHNTSLESITMWGLADFFFIPGESNPSDLILHLGWLAAVLNTIESRENFKDFTGYLWCRSGDDLTEETHRWITSFDWAPVEDAILDSRRFPSEPRVTLGLGGDLKYFLKVPVLRDECMPRLAKARRLMVADCIENDNFEEARLVE